MASLKRWLDLRRNPWKAPFNEGFKRWRSENGLQKLYDYDGLRPGAVVLDFGGFEGEWTALVRKAQPAAICHIFEPHPVFAKELHKKFDPVDGVHVHEFALGRAAGTLALDDAGDASSGFGNSDGAYSAPIRPVTEFFEEHEIGMVDLVKMNIEGGEYDLLPAMIDSGLIGKVRRLQVQFHLFDKSLVARREEIREKLAKTHDCVWAYPFVWEEWRLKDTA
ncbi:FkbM family methyltransferase [Arenibacterium sp. CAU 1754]